MTIQDRKLSSIFLDLRGREQNGRCRRSSLRVRGYCLDDFIPVDHPAVNSVILGFMHDGEHFIAYQEGNEESPSFELIIWKFSLHCPLSCCSKIKLFQCCSGVDFHTSDVGDELSSPIRIRMIEILPKKSRPSAVLVHASQGSNQEQLADAQRHSVSLIMGLLSRKSLCVLHTTYFVQPPYPVLDLRHSLLIGDDYPTAMLIVNTGDTIRFLNIVTQDTDKMSVKDSFLFDETDLEEEGTMRFASSSKLDANIEWRNHNGTSVGCGEEISESAVLEQCSFDVEMYLARLLAEMSPEIGGNKKTGSGKLHLADYDIRIVESATNNVPEADDQHGQNCVAIGVIAVLKRCAWHENYEEHRCMSKVEADADTESSYMLVSHLLLLCCKTAEVLARLSTRACSCPAAAAATSARSRLVHSELRAWRAALATPMRPNSGAGARRDFVEWDNDGVLEGRCAERLVNPIYPIVITPPRRAMH